MSVARVVAKGLEGVIVDTSNICLIDGNAGRLVYRGYDIHDLTATVDFEEAAYLLWNGDLPTQSQLADLRKRLSDERPISSNLKATIANLPLVLKHFGCASNSSLCARDRVIPQEARHLGRDSDHR